MGPPPHLCIGVGVKFPMPRIKMRQIIVDFPKQFIFEPKIENRRNFKSKKSLIVLGMGGSALAADLAKIANPQLEILAHRNYGLPAIPKSRLKNSLIVASSVSGNTEEVVDGFKIALKLKLATIVVSKNGRLLELAKKFKIPYIQLPKVEMPPRMALGYQLLAIFKAGGEERIIKDLRQAAKNSKPLDWESRGKKLAKKIKGFVPIIYSSAENQPLAYNWKVSFNETSKIPAFFNVFSELNHNEMAGFGEGKTKKLTENFFFIFLKDKNDRPEIAKRMTLTAKLFQNRNLPAEIIELKGKNVFERIFSSLILAYWTAFYLAKIYNVDPQANLLIEKFKKELAKK